MLKITRAADADSVRLTLSGRITQADLDELARALLSESVQPASIILDLEEIGLIDRDAVRFLVRWEAAGIRLVNAAGYIREWMHNEHNSSTDEPRREIRSHE